MSHPGRGALPKAPRKRAPELVYQLHVSLEELRPLIWRRLWVPDTLTLVKLDRVVQTAMGWNNSHLHEFEIDGARYTMLPDEYDDIDPPGCRSALGKSATCCSTMSSASPTCTTSAMAGSTRW